MRKTVSLGHRTAQFYHESVPRFPWSQLGIDSVIGPCRRLASVGLIAEHPQVFPRQINALKHLAIREKNDLRRFPKNFFIQGQRKANGDNVGVRAKLPLDKVTILFEEDSLPADGFRHLDGIFGKREGRPGLSSGEMAAIFRLYSCQGQLGPSSAREVPTMKRAARTTRRIPVCFIGSGGRRRGDVSCVGYSKVWRYSAMSRTIWSVRPMSAAAGIQEVFNCSTLILPPLRRKNFCVTPPNIFRFMVPAWWL